MDKEELSINILIFITDLSLALNMALCLANALYFSKQMSYASLQFKSVFNMKQNQLYIFLMYVIALVWYS